MEKTADIVERLAAPVAEKYGCALWDVDFVKEGGTWFLRVFIDREGGVDINHCERVSRDLDVILDKTDPIEQSYVLEVSSAGLERALKRQRDFDMFIGSLVEVRLFKPYAGSKEHFGKLAARNDTALKLDVSGTTVEFNNVDIALVRLRIEL